MGVVHVPESHVKLRVRSAPTMCSTEHRAAWCTRPVYLPPSTGRYTPPSTDQHRPVRINMPMYMGWSVQGCTGLYWTGYTAAYTPASTYTPAYTPDIALHGGVGMIKIPWYFLCLCLFAPDPDSRPPRCWGVGGRGDISAGVHTAVQYHPRSERIRYLHLPVGWVHLTHFGGGARATCEV